MATTFVLGANKALFMNRVLRKYIVTAVGDDASTPPQLAQLLDMDSGRTAVADPGSDSSWEAVTVNVVGDGSHCSYNGRSYHVLNKITIGSDVWYDLLPFNASEAPSPDADSVLHNVPAPYVANVVIA